MKKLRWSLILFQMVWGRRWKCSFSNYDGGRTFISDHFWSLIVDLTLVKMTRLRCDEGMPAHQESMPIDHWPIRRGLPLITTGADTNECQPIIGKYPHWCPPPQREPRPRWRRSRAWQGRWWWRSSRTPSPSPCSSSFSTSRAFSTKTRLTNIISANHVNFQGQTPPGMSKCVLGWCLPLDYQKLESPTPDEPVIVIIIIIIWTVWHYYYHHHHHYLDSVTISLFICLIDKLMVRRPGS